MKEMGYYNLNEYNNEEVKVFTASLQNEQNRNCDANHNTN